jgi:hypothetical protein
MPQVLEHIKNRLAARIAEPVEWANETWNPLCGCDVIEAECDDCYAERCQPFGPTGPKRHDQD